MQVNVLEAKNTLSQLIRSAQAGEDVLIANRGQAVARLIAISPAAMASRTTAGDAASFLNWLKKNPLPVHLQREHEAIEAGIAEERAAWD